MVNTSFTLAIMLNVITMFEQIFLGFGLDRYLLTIPFLIPALLYRATRGYFQYADSLLIAGDKPNIVMTLRVFEELGKMLCLFLTIAVFRVQDFGIYGVVYAITLGDYPASLAKAIIAYVYVNKKLFKLRINAWQTFFAPLTSTAILFSIFYTLKEVVLLPLFEINMILSLVIAVLVLLVMVIFFYFPLTVLLGGWDDNSLRDFRRAEKMSGPSKILVKPIGKSIYWAAKRAKLHNWKKIPDEAAIKELRELVATRDENR